VIEGARLLPWLQEAARSRPGAVELFQDCEKCMKANPPEIRQTMACGFLPAPSSSMPVTPGGQPDGFKHEMTTCIGYTTRLPEVIEVSRARLHWDKGTLRDWCGGETATPSLLLALEEMESQDNASQAHAMDVARRKGGRQ
jgi:hypothetical protein